MPFLKKPVLDTLFHSFGLPDSLRSIFGWVSDVEFSHYSSLLGN